MEAITDRRIGIRPPKSYRARTLRRADRRLRARARRDRVAPPLAFQAWLPLACRVDGILRGARRRSAHERVHRAWNADPRLRTGCAPTPRPWSAPRHDGTRCTGTRARRRRRADP